MSNRTLTLMMGFVAVLILAVGVVFVVVLAGSGGDDDSSGTTDRKTPGAKTAGGICGGNVLIIPGDEPNTVLDPIQVGDVSTAEYVAEIFGGLVTLDLQLNIVPDIAEKWDISADGKTYTFHLREDVVFHNGRRVTADDFKYSLERAADPANASLQVLPYLGGIVGVKERFANKATEVKGVRVIDEKTLQIELEQPEAFFLAELTYPVAYVVDKDQIKNQPRNWTQKPNGTGPFRVAEFKAAERIRLVRNDRYHLGVAKVDEIVFELGGGSVSTRFENDEIHVAGVPLLQLDAVKAGNSPLSQFYKPQPEMSLSYIAFNVKAAPFDDPKVRQAFAMAVDYKNINENLFFNALRVADGILPPEMPGYKESIAGYKYDPAKAKQLLAESKYAGKMPAITLKFSGAAGGGGDLLEALQSDWQDVLGVTVDLQGIDPSAYLRERKKKTFQMLADGWIADYPDPENFVGKLFSGSSDLNVLNYANPDVDGLLDQARNERDRTKRLAMYNEAEQKILDDAVVIPQFWGVAHYLVKDCVKNWPSAPIPIPKYRYVEIDTTKK